MASFFLLSAIYLRWMHERMDAKAIAVVLPHSPRSLRVPVPGYNLDFGAL